MSARCATWCGASTPRKLAVIPAGGTPEEPTQVLASTRMKQFLKAVRDNFDEVYIDLPPTLPFADAGILGHQVDGVLMVVRANVTPTQGRESGGGAAGRALRSSAAC